MTKCAKIEGGSSQQFNFLSFNLSTNIYTSVDCHYAMPDGSPCTDTVQCSASSPNTVQSTKCQAAHSVTFQLPSSASQGNCQIAIQQVQFNCPS